MSLFTRLSNGWTITMNSFQILKENKQLIIFPILSGISMILILGSFGTAFFAAAGWNVDNINNEDPLLNYALIFLFYFVNYFVVVFFNTALIHCTRLYFKGEEVTVSKGLNFALSRLSAILLWALFAATAGTILKIIQENVGWIGKIITGLIGVVWSIATFFVVPVIAYENAGPLQAFKRSTQIMKEKWGESLASTFSFGLIQFIAVLIVGVPLFILGSVIHIFAGIALAVLGLLLVSVILSATQTIFISAVYHNVTGNPVQHYNQQLIDNMFEHK
jgi:hypothetical protein